MFEDFLTFFLQRGISGHWARESPEHHKPFTTPTGTRYAVLNIETFGTKSACLFPAMFAACVGLSQTFKHCPKIDCKLMINKRFVVFEAFQTFSNISNILQTRVGFKHANTPPEPIKPVSVVKALVPEQEIEPETPPEPIKPVSVILRHLL